MKFIHIALECRSLDRSDTFYQDILGLKKIKTSNIPATIINRISSYDEEITAVLYGNDNFMVEVFIVPSKRSEHKDLSHTCIEVSSITDFISQCRKFGIDPIEIQKGDRTITFVPDFDDNLFEVKGVGK